MSFMESYTNYHNDVAEEIIIKKLQVVMQKSCKTLITFLWKTFY